MQYSSHGKNQLDELDASLLKLRNSVYKNNIIVSGDFNAPDISWDTEYSSQSPAFDRLLEIIDNHDLSQHVKEPTRRERNTQNILDLILSNNPNIIDDVRVVPGISDHGIVLFTVNTSCRRKKNVIRKIFIRKKADSTRIKEELIKLSFDVDTRGFNSIDDKWSCFEDNIHRIMDSCIPSKWTSSRYNLPYREVTGSSPVEVLNFFQASLRNCKNCDHNCEDHSSFDFISAVHI